MVFTEQTEPDHDLLAWLDELFPDCEIQIGFKWTETFGEYPADCFHFRLQGRDQER
jgi:hypothetical protein